MADSAAFESARKGSDRAVAAPPANEPSPGAPASRPRPAGGLLRPSRVPALRVPDLLPGPGQPLAAPVRQEMEARLGADLSQVRIHAGSAARARAAGLGARAYTVGSHVVTGDAGADRRVLAHELTHVIQQRQGPVAGTDHGGGVKVSDPSDRDERAAEANAVRVMAAPAAAPRQFADAGQFAKSSADPDRAPGAPVVQRVIDYSGPSIGVEQEITSGPKVYLPNENDRGRLGMVKKGGTVLVEFTSDMGGDGDMYTIELRTTPSVKNAQTGELPQGILDRQEATKVMVGAILRAGARKGPVVPGTYGDYTIEIEKPNHAISLIGQKIGKTLSPDNPADEKVVFANQATVGVKTSDLVTGGSQEVQLILGSAKWFKPGLESELPAEGLVNAGSAKMVYALVASVIRHLQQVFAASKVKPEGDEIPAYIYESSVKDDWGVLPRTPPWDWIKALDEKDQVRVKDKLRSIYSGKTSEPAARAAFKHIAYGVELAGHTIPESTIGGERASVFEFREVPGPLHPYLYSSPGGEWELPEELIESEKSQAKGLAPIKIPPPKIETTDFFKKAEQRIKEKEAKAELRSKEEKTASDDEWDE